MIKNKEKMVLVQAWLNPPDVEILDALADKFACSRAAVLKMIIKNITIDFNINLTMNKKERDVQ